VQLLRVLVNVSSPRLEVLFAHPLQKMQARYTPGAAHTPITRIPSQVIDNTLTLEGPELGRLTMVHIPSASDAARRGTPIPTKCWMSPNMFRPVSDYAGL
jgi:hypothetical protein